MCIVIWSIVGLFIGQIRTLKVRIYGVILTCTDGYTPTTTELWMACQWSRVVGDFSSEMITVGTNLVYVSLAFYIYRLNLFIIFTSMGFIAHSAPNFSAAQTSLGVPPGPVITQLFASLPLFSQVSRLRV